jgi:hypothetical protein
MASLKPVCGPEYVAKPLLPGIWGAQLYIAALPIGIHFFF